MAFCTKCGKQIETGTVCGDCAISNQSAPIPNVTSEQPPQPPVQQAQPVQQPQPISQPQQPLQQQPAQAQAVQQPQQPSAVTDMKNKVKEHHAFKYYLKRLSNTAANQADDDFKLSLYAVIALFAGFTLVSLVNIIFGGSFLRGYYTRLMFVVLIAVCSFFGATYAMYAVAKKADFKKLIVNFANRSVLAVCMLAVSFVLSLIGGLLRLGGTVSALLWSLAFMLISLASVTLSVEETSQINSSRKFYILAGIVCAQGVVIGLLVSSLLRF